MRSVKDWWVLQETIFFNTPSTLADGQFKRKEKKLKRKKEKRRRYSLTPLFFFWCPFLIYFQNAGCHQTLFNLPRYSKGYLQRVVCKDVIRMPNRCLESSHTALATNEGISLHWLLKHITTWNVPKTGNSIHKAFLWEALYPWHKCW